MAVDTVNPILGSNEGLAAAEPSQIAIIWRRFRRHRLAVLGLISLTILIVACIFGPIYSGFHGYTRMAPVVNKQYANPSLQHLLGTDDYGRDMMERLLVAGRLSLFIGLGATALAVIFGCLYGAIAGYNPGLIDSAMMRLVDLCLSLPDLPILLVLSILFRVWFAGWRAPFVLGFEPPEVKAITIFALILSLLGWMGISRLVRSQIIALREQSFIEATRALGAGAGRIVFRHMLPNALAPIIVATTLATGNFIILESTLSYLGYGVDPLTPTWGNMLFSVQEVIWSRPYLALYPGLLILITVLSINFVGDALRDALDPRLKH